jgi:DUF1016 N-terminal domain
MATLIPSIGTCVSRMTSGERRMAERLEQKLDADYLMGYDVPIGEKIAHPDFVVMHPRRGLLQDNGIPLAKPISCGRPGEEPSSRQRQAGAVNAKLTRLYRSVGARPRTEVLGGADCAKYGDQLINRVGNQLAQEFGRGFETKNLRRMLQFAGAFPDTEKVASLMRHLSGSHFVNLLPHQTEPARQFYASRAKRPPSASSCAPNPAANRWSCCKCTKTASPWPNTGPNCHPKRSWSKNCMQLCLKCANGWRDAACCWESLMMREASISQYDLLIRPAPSTRRGAMQVLMAV